MTKPAGDPGPDPSVEPLRELAVPPARLRASGGGRARGIVVMAGLAVVLVGAVAVAQLPSTPQHAPIARLDPTDAPSSTPTIVVASSAGPRTATSRRLR